MAKTATVSGFIGPSVSNYPYGKSNQHCYVPIAINSNVTYSRKEDTSGGWRIFQLNNQSTNQLKAPDNAYVSGITIANCVAKRQGDGYGDTTAYLYLTSSAAYSSSNYDKLQLIAYQNQIFTSRTIFNGTECIPRPIANYPNGAVPQITGKYLAISLEYGYSSDGYMTYTFNGSTGSSVSVTYTYLTGTVNITKTSGGTIAITNSNNQTITSPVELAAGEYIYVTATPDSGRSLTGIDSSISGVVTLVSGNKYQITMPSPVDDLQILFKFRPAVLIGNKITKSDMDAFKTYVQQTSSRTPTTVTQYEKITATIGQTYK